MMRTLLVLAHYDDEAISCPQYLIDNPGTFVFIICGDDDRKDEFDECTDKVLAHGLHCNFKPLRLTTDNIPALARAIESIVVSTPIQRVITHHPEDIHQDHRIVNHAVQVALRRLDSVELLYAKNPEGFPFTNVNWDTRLERSKSANQLAKIYKNIKQPPKQEYDWYQSVRRFSI